MQSLKGGDKKYSKIKQNISRNYSRWKLSNKMGSYSPLPLPSAVKLGKDFLQFLWMQNPTPWRGKSRAIPPLPSSHLLFCKNVGGGGRGTSRLLFETIILNAFNPPPPPLAILTYRVPVLQDIVLCVCKCSLQIFLQSKFGQCRYVSIRGGPEFAELFELQVYRYRYLISELYVLYVLLRITYKPRTKNGTVSHD